MLLLIESDFDNDPSQKKIQKKKNPTLWILILLELNKQKEIQKKCSIHKRDLYHFVICQSSDGKT